MRATVERVFFVLKVDTILLWKERETIHNKNVYLSLQSTTWKRHLDTDGNCDNFHTVICS